MKRVLLMSLTLGLILVASCKDETKNRPRVVGLLIGPEYVSQSKIIVRAAEEAAKADGRGVIVSQQIKEPTDEAYHKGFEQLQTVQINDTKLSGLVLTGNPAFDLNEDIRGTALKGKPVVVFSQDYPDSLRDIFVTTDNALAGKMLGQTVGRAPANGSKVIAIVTGPSDNDKQTRILGGLRNELSQYAHISVLKTITHRDNKQTAQELKTLLKKTPTLYALVSTGPWIFHSELAGTLANYKGRVYAVANTPEAFNALKNNRATALVVEDLYQQAFLAAQFCFMKLRSITVNQPVPLKPTLVTRDTLEEVLAKWGQEPLQSDKTNSTQPEPKTGDQ